MSYGITTTVDQPFAPTLAAVKDALKVQGFGILTEIDMAATLKAKLDADIAPQVILGACNPPLAYRALSVEPSIGLLLPCNVVVRSVAPERTLVEAIDPQVMVQIGRDPRLAEVAADARARLTAALEKLAAADVVS